MNKAEMLTRRLQDARRKRVVFLSHCILNENVRYLGGALRGGCVAEIVRQCVEHDIGMVQMPCPEFSQRVVVRVLGHHRSRPEPATDYAATGRRAPAP